MTERRYWKAADDAHLIWRSWEESGVDEPLTLIYFRNSDDTHLLNSLGVRMVRLLQQESLTLDALLEKLEKTDDTLPEPKQVERFLKQLERVGILEVEIR